MIWIVWSTGQGPIQAFEDKMAAQEFCDTLKQMGAPVVVNCVALVKKVDDAECETCSFFGV